MYELSMHDIKHIIDACSFNKNEPECNLIFYNYTAVNAKLR